MSETVAAPYGSLSEPFVRTVLGDVPRGSLGFALPHEHTQITLWDIQNRWDYWELTKDVELIEPELRRFRELGGTCLADLTLPGNGRDPLWLTELARRSGLALVMGAGWYRTAYYPPEARIDRRSTDDLADELVGEFERGVGETGVRPGILGEIGTDKPWLTAQEERVFRAVGRAARRTGMAVSTHAVLSPVGEAQLRVLEEEGLDPARVVIGHADSYPRLDHYLEICRRGANLEFDFLGMDFTPMERHDEPRIVRRILELLEAGFGDRILLSQDVCHNSQLTAYEGHGYTYLQETFLPRLREHGVDDATLRCLTVDNPLRILTIAA
jgi:predicted metal-dependent phosphotriesterase family hydrolase